MIADAAPLLERAAQLEALAACYDAVGAEGRGRFALVAGEAGIGKTALVRAFCAGRPRVLWGACDALYTPRPLGPLVDIAEEAGGELAALVAQARHRASSWRRSRPSCDGGRRRSSCSRTCTGPTRRRSTSCGCSARRIEALPALVDRDLPRRRARPRAPAAHRARRRCRSRVAARVAAGRRCRRTRWPRWPARASTPARCTGATGGNPFFVTEALAAGGADLPATVRDAVLARAARLDSGGAGAARRGRDRPAARRAVAAGGARPRPSRPRSTRAWRPGCCAPSRDAVAFRHEIARVAIEEALSPLERLRLHRRALAALAAAAGARPRPARPPRRGGRRRRGRAALRPGGGRARGRAGRAPRGRRAVRARAALRRRPAAGPARRPARAPLVRVLPHRPDRRGRSRPAARRSRPATIGDRCARATRIAGCRAWPGSRGDNATAEREGQRGASSCSSRCRRGASWRWRTATWPSCGCSPTTSPARRPGASARSSSRSGSATARSSPTRSTTSGPRGCSRARRTAGALLERSLELALEAGLEEHVARAYTNLGSGLLDVRDLAPAARYLDAGIEYCAERDLDSWLLYMSG